MNEIAKAIYDQFGGNRAMAMIDGVALTSKDRLTIKYAVLMHQ